FVGGDTAEDCLPLLEQYRAENKGCLFAYSVEVDENEAAGKDAGGAAKDVQPVHKRIVQEMIHSIDVAADFEERHVVNPADPAKGRKTWVAIKLTALLPHAQSLIKFSSHLIKTRPPTPDIPFPGIPHASDLSVLYDSTPPPSSPLTEADIVELRELHQDLVRICTRAKEMGVRIILDAEYSWYQPAIDAYVYALVRQFNSRSDFPASDATPNVQPLVYQTYQAYLRRTPGYLNQSIRDAYLHNYALGVKLVRGAYHPHETLAHPSSAQTSAALRSLSISPDPLLPVWAEKAETDRCYNECARVLVENIRHDVETRRGGASFWSWGRRQGQERDVPRIGVLFGTHNWESANKILEELAKNGLAEREREDGEDVFRVPEAVTERLTMGQLYGMCDALTDYLVDKTRCSAPFVIKYVPYGALSEVMPYLSRRAIENKSVLGNGAAAMERKRAWNEIRKRLFG
ncbi:FAD-linked oxidoreductase, partial [Gloeophyllum trabeum ATCC 11539]